MFWKCGIEAFIRNYKINNFNEFFLEEDKQKMRFDFYSLICNLINDIFLHTINKNYSNSEDKNKFKIYEKISKLKKNLKNELDFQNENNFLNNVNSILRRIKKILNYHEDFDSITSFLAILTAEVPENINEFYYSIAFYNNDNIPNNSVISNFSINSIIGYENIRSFITYYSKLLERKNLEDFFSGKTSSKIDFEEIVNNENFRNKIINIYSSKKMKQFIDDCCPKCEKEKLKSNLPYLLKLLKGEEFWKQIMFFPLIKNKMGTMENYLRIVINTEYVEYKNLTKEKKRYIQQLLLFELLFHEIFHMFLRFNFINYESGKALTPPSAKDIGVGKNTGEIGKELINYFFNQPIISIITSEAGKTFDSLTFETEEDIDVLMTILEKVGKNGLDEDGYVRFSDSGIEGAIFYMLDCIDFAK